MDGFGCHGCVVIKRLSDAAFQIVDTEPGGGRDGNHVSEAEVILRSHVVRQQIRELCRREKGEMVRNQTKQKDLCQLLSC